MTPVIMPLGDVQEFTIVTAAQALAGEKAALSALAARYGTDEVVVADAVASADGTKLNVTVTRYGAADAAPLKRSYQDTADTVMATAAGGALLALGEQWKREIIVRGGEKASLTASAFFTSLDQWEAIRKGLTSTPLVQGVQVEGIASGGAEIEIDYRGTPDKLALSLAQQNVALSQEEGGWSLRMR
jgi:VCBS repeat-containing protein